MNKTHYVQIVTHNIFPLNNVSIEGYHKTIKTIKSLIGKNLQKFKKCLIILPMYIKL